ncbi:MAG: substrate-binding domain-containing protein [Magnetococcales bacterium]|nr:substrate-binding domain-containing protein [Magnetococcales bacterium]
MKNIHKKYIIHGWLAIFFLWIGSPSWAAEPIRISGTGAAISAIKQVTELYRQRQPEIQVQFYLPPMGSSGAIKALTTHTLDMALSGRPLKKEEETAGLMQEWIGRSPFLFVVHEKLLAPNVTLAQLVEIFSGRQKTWPDGSRVRVILRPQADADTVLLKAISPAMDEAITTAHANRASGSALADTDIDLANMVERVPGGVGAVALTLILAEQRPLKGLTLDGVEPTVPALEKNNYPYYKPFFLITRTDAPAPVRALADFLLTDESKALLLKLGISATKP